MYTFVPQDRQDSFDPMSVEKLVYFTTLSSAMENVYVSKCEYYKTVLKNRT